jgi:hypothetical protein
LAAFPVSDTEIVLICPQAVHPSMDAANLYHLESGRAVRAVELNEEHAERILLRVESSMTDPKLTIDRVIITDFKSKERKKAREAISPRFIRNVYSAMELKVPHFSETFPYSSSLVGLHVSVECCTGCNGGIHDRNLVVLNHHLGGGWSGIWVQTGKTIEAPYPRWQKVLCAGGVIAELNGSMTVVDEGWMEIYKQNEIPHHPPPPPLPIETVDLPAEQTASLICKGLDGAWVQFQDITIEGAVFIDAQERIRGAVNLPRTEILLRDHSEGRSKACLYQASGHKVTAGQQLRGFVHAEEPGVYVLLSDKEEDIVL